MTVFCITQARLGSTRLPRKVLMPINDLPMIDYQFERLTLSNKIDNHILATSTSAIDDPLAQHCIDRAYRCFRGDEDNVLARFYFAALDAGALENDIIVRLTGDCPLTCPRLMDEVIDAHQQYNATGYTHTDLTFFARGFDIEVFSMKVLTDTFANASSKMELEHVTYYIYHHTHQYPKQSIQTGNANWSNFRLCVDEPNDFRMMASLIDVLGHNWREVDARTICRMLEKNPALVEMNRNVMQHQHC